MGIFDFLQRSDDYRLGQAMRDNPELLKYHLEQQQAQQMAPEIERLYGQMAKPQETAPFQADTFPGEQPISGLETITQEASPATGMFEQGISDQDKLMRFNREMAKTGIPGFMEQWSGNQRAMQNSQMGNMGQMAKMIKQQQMERATPKLTSAMQNIEATGLTPGSKPYQQAMKKYMEKSGVTVNNKLGGDNRIKPEHAKQMVDSEGNPVKVGVNDTYADADSRGWSYGQQMTAEEAKTNASAVVSIKMAQDLLGMLESGMDLSGFEGWAEGQRAGAGITNIALETALNLAGYTSDPTNVKGVAIAENLSNTVLQALRGAAVGPAEQDRVDKQLPRPGQPLEVFKQNILLTIENLKMIQSSKEASRGTGSTHPNWDTSKGPRPGLNWKK